MSEDEQKIAIVEACGWTHYEHERGDGEIIILYRDTYGSVYKQLPAYLNNNAMHEAKKILTPQQRVNFSNELAVVCGTEFEKIFATAAQEAKAFLRAIGRWKE